MEFDGYGLFRVGNEYTKMNPLQCARYRAERDAMKAAFPISLPPGVSAKVIDEETSEVINGSHDEGPRWDVITTEQAAPPIEQHDAALESQIMSDAPAQPAEPQERKSYRMANVKFSEALPIDKWHDLSTSFAASNPNWLTKNNLPDMNHILASAGHAGYQYITYENVAQMFTDIAKAHEAKQA